MPDPLKLFISYRSSDARKVDKIARDLALLKYEDGTPRYAPWQDKHHLPPASPNWWDAIVDAIDNCPVFVFHISAESLKSTVCQAELEYAHKRNRPIIPIVLEGEFFLDETSGKYDLPKASWTHVPSWLGERQFLFYTGADFYRQFEMAMDVFRRNWPKEIRALRPLNPSDPTSNHALYDQACDYAERLAFAEAEKLFDALVRRNDRHYGAESAEWIDLLRRYAELIEVDALPRSRFRFKPLWEEYAALFPKPFLEGLFDPKGFVGRRDAPAAPIMTAEEYLDRGYKFYITGQHNRAIADYTEAIRLNPQNATFYTNRGMSHGATGEHDRAIADYTEAIRLNPQYDKAYYNRGISYAAKGDHHRAVVDYTEAIRINPQYTHAYMRRGISYTVKGEYKQAIEDHTKAIHLKPQDALAYISRADSYSQTKDYDQAIADYDQALAINPNHPTAAISRQRAFNARAAIQPPTPAETGMTAEAYFQRAEEHRKQKRYDEAIADYTEVIRIKPDDARAYNNRGMSHDTNGQVDRAIVDYNEAIRLNPHYVDAYIKRGNYYHAQGEHDQAIADYDRALEIYPGHPRASRNRQRAFNARAASQPPTPAEPEMTAEGYFRRATEHHLKSRLDEAIADYSEAIRLNPQYADAYYWRGSIYEVKNAYDQALADFDRVLEIDPNHPYVTINRQSTLNELAKGKKATPPAETGMTAEEYYHRALEHQIDGRFNEAIPDYNAALRLNPQYVNAYINRGACYANKSDYDRAIADYDAALKIDPKHAFVAGRRQEALTAKNKRKR